MSDTDLVEVVICPTCRREGSRFKLSGKICWYNDAFRADVNISNDQVLCDRCQPHQQAKPEPGQLALLEEFMVYLRAQNRGADEDLILELMDRLTGFCGPGMVLEG